MCLSYRRGFRTLTVPASPISNRDSIYDTSSGRSLEGVSAVNKASEELEKQSSNEPKPTGQIEHLERGQTPINSFGPRKRWVQGEFPSLAIILQL